MSGGSFTQKLITVNFTLGKGAFGAQLGNTKVISGLRCEVQIDKNGHPSKNKLAMKIYGLSESDMQTMANVPKRALSVAKNRIQVLAGDASSMAVAFEGEVTGAWMVYKSPPNLLFHVEALAGFYPALAPVPPSSVKGTADVAGMMATLAGQMGYTFQNNGVSAKISDPYFPGTALQQAHDLADAANLEFGIDDGILFIAPRGQPRKGDAPLVSPATGLDEYPVFDKKGIKLTTLYNPAIKLGGLIVVQSVVKNAVGTWRVNGLKHRLESLNPGGKWHSDVKASWVGN